MMLWRWIKLIRLLARGAVVYLHLHPDVHAGFTRPHHSAAQSEVAVKGQPALE